MGKRELIALLNLSSWCLVMVERLFLVVPRGCLQFVIVVFPDHTHLLFLVVSAVLTFWVGIGRTVILHVPKIKKVSTATCEYFNRTCPGDKECSIFNATMMSTISTLAATTTAKSIPPEENM